jgi:hypothetical protein
MLDSPTRSQALSVTRHELWTHLSSPLRWRVHAGPFCGTDESAARLQVDDASEYEIRHSHHGVGNFFCLCCWHSVGKCCRIHQTTPEHACLHVAKAMEGIGKGLCVCVRARVLGYELLLCYCCCFARSPPSHTLQLSKSSGFRLME